MSTFYHTFETDTLSQFPSSDFNNDWFTNGSAVVVADSGSIGGQAFDIPGPNSAFESYFRCATIGTSSSGQLVEVYQRFKVDNISATSNVRCIARGAAAETAHANRGGIVAYWDGFGGGSVGLFHWITGTLTNIGSRVDVSGNSAVNTYMNLLLQVNGTGTGATVKSRFWAGGIGDEPATWTHEETLGVTINSGTSGIGHYAGTQDDTTVGLVSIGYGEAAYRPSGFINKGCLSLGIRMGL